ncbi:predicted protein [Aspergillus nidulans FGSC A4]|uniref:Uncharacterized protein n=1 Tax=Emericella nidulans (strain FGSC A4 / ATCC 38163 / CBS 112.46 / NRRL 194 / M139) TaxID=227321 RepID=Q5ATP8_EMENI|nr:hypothetical protein [Aspergillus nidulans FGSC A4]EAA66955.1 predicted protein [Aspergillus nidulans FGSC A4]CBF80325.1 TPA: hypothetical protein ANIA_08332 [Aspergillus nidulans FGSC A4]|eukprot:XP_681601.1 predicted protein [Aspergillus nidulans FGSC A4]
MPFVFWPRALVYRGFSTASILRRPVWEPVRYEHCTAAGQNQRRTGARTSRPGTLFTSLTIESVHEDYELHTSALWAYTGFGNVTGSHVSGDAVTACRLVGNQTYF